MWQILLAILATFLIIKYKPIQDWIFNKLEQRAAFKKVVGPKAHWLWGHLFIIYPNQRGITAHRERMKMFPKMQVMNLGLVLTFVSCYYPSVIGTILSVDRAKEYWGRMFFKSWIGDGLLFSHGSRWKRKRKLLTPAFHFDILKNYVDIFNKSADIMLRKWEAKHGPVEISEDVSLLTLDNMLQCMMSYKSDCQELGQSHPYVKAVHEMSIIIVRRYFLQPFMRSDFLFNLTSMGRKFNTCVNIAKEQTSEVIRNRIEMLKEESKLQVGEKRRPDFLDILLLTKDSEGNGLSGVEIRDEVDTFLFEGHDTTSSAVSWILYDLATNIEHQTLCRQEINNVLGESENFQQQDVSRLNYLTLCIKESMRIHPPVPILARTPDTPVTFTKDFGEDQLNTTTNEALKCTQTFPSHSMLELSLFNLHMNPHIWNNPNKFDPLRFKPENYSKLSNYSYIPFSAGPRNCIGQNFAMMEIKITIAKCLNKFEFYVDEECPLSSMILRLVLKSETGITLKLKPIAKGDCNL